MKYFRRHFKALYEKAPNRWVLIQDDHVQFFDRSIDAANEGYRLFGTRTPFLVTRVSQTQTPCYISPRRIA